MIINQGSQSNKRLLAGHAFETQNRIVKYPTQKFYPSPKHPISFIAIARIQSSENKHKRHVSTVSKFTQPMSVSIWFWHHDFSAKRTLMEVWKANGRKSYIAKSDHQTRGSLIIVVMQGVAIAMQMMHIELYVYESSPMELVGVHLTWLLMKTQSILEEAHHQNIQPKFYNGKFPTQLYQMKHENSLK